jgi:5,10-methylenetetrahydromethanopterin reductase
VNKHQVSIAFQTDKPPAEYIAIAKLVDQFDFDVVSVYMDLPYHPSFGPLLLMAPHIRRARIGVASISPIRMHPVDIAANAALLASTASGGIYIGLARGAWLEDFGFQEQPAPIQGIKEACQIIRNILSGAAMEFHGKVYQIPSQTTAPYPLPSGYVPLLVGTWGEKLAAVAGEVADEVKVGGSTNPDFGQYIRASIQQGEARTNRPKGTVGVVLGAVTIVDEDRKLAREKAKEALVQYFPVVAGLDKTLSIEPELIDRVRNAAQQGNVKSAAGLIPDDLLDKFAFSGNPQDVIQQSEALFNAGVNRIEFGTPHGLPSSRGIKLIGENVLPYLRNQWGKG